MFAKKDSVSHNALSRFGMRVPAMRGKGEVEYMHAFALTCFGQEFAIIACTKCLRRKAICDHNGSWPNWGFKSQHLVKVLDEN